MNHERLFSLHRACTIALLVTLAAAAHAEAGGPQTAKLDATAARRASQLTGRSRVIVEFYGDADVRVFGRASIGRRLGSRTRVAEVDNRALVALSADPRVKRVVIDRPTLATLERTGAATGAVAAREDFGLSGRGVGVAVIDSGITSHHDDLYYTRNGRRSERIAHFRDFTLDAPSSVWASDSPTDPYGHGTHVAGAIAGNGYDSRGARQGIAPNATLVGLKVLDADGNGYISDVIAALEYAISIKSTYNIRVINLSVAAAVTESYLSDPLTLAARRAVEAGIVVVTAAGNLGQNELGASQFGGITSPANAPWVLTVGASSHQGTAKRGDDIVAAFSSRGPTWIDFAAKPDILAPGVGTESLSDPHSTLYAILSDYLLAGVRNTWYKPYLSLSGTSMAAPVVTGTIALMLEANPALTPNAVKAILQYTAQAGRGEHPLAQGAGLLNTRGATRLAQFFAAPERGVGTTSDVIEGERIAWAQHILWGNYLVRGGVPLPGSNAWDSLLTWGAFATADGRPVVWGAQDDGNIVWSTDSDGNIVWSTNGDGNIVWSTDDDANIVWSTDSDGNIVWSTEDDHNIVWSTATARNVVWGTDCGGHSCRGVIWGSSRHGRVWGAMDGDANIVWSTGDDGNIVWSTDSDGNIVWSTDENGNIVWSTGDDGNIVWSTGDDGNIVWSTNDDGNIVWSTGAVQRVLWPAAAR